MPALDPELVLGLGLKLTLWLLAFGFWLLAFGFCLLCYLVSSGDTIFVMMFLSATLDVKSPWLCLNEFSLLISGRSFISFLCNK